MVSLGDQAAAHLSNHHITRTNITYHIEASFPIQLAGRQCVDKVLEQARPAGEQTDCVNKNQGLYNLHDTHVCDDVFSLHCLSPCFIREDTH